MPKYRESLWAKILRFLMPADGTHAHPEEKSRTGEQPVLPDDYDEGDLIYDEEATVNYYRHRETRMDLPVLDPLTPLTRPYLKAA